MKWTLASIFYMQQDEQGKMKKISQSYLFEAESYTEAEKKVYAFFEGMHEITIDKILKMKLQEIFFVENGGDLWFKVKVVYIMFDEKTQKEKKTPYNFLINAENVRQANDLVNERCGPINDYVISDINSTNILEVIPHEPDTTVTGKLTPIPTVE